MVDRGFWLATGGLDLMSCNSTLQNGKLAKVVEDRSL